MITAQYSMTPSVTQFQAVELQERGHVTDIFRLKYESFSIVQEDKTFLVKFKGIDVRERS